MIKVRVKYTDDIRQISKFAAQKNIAKYGRFRVFLDYIVELAQILYIKVKTPIVNTILSNGIWRFDSKNAGTSRWEDDSK